MPRPTKELMEELTSLIEGLNGEAQEDALVVVEGPRDAEALRSLGFIGPLFLLCHQGGLSRLVERANGYGKVILLTDLDSEGKALAKRAALALKGRHRIDLSYRRRLAPFARLGLLHLEDLAGLSDYFDLPLR